METLGDKNQQNSAFKYYCNICDYGTHRKCNYDAHNISLKHHKLKLETNGNKIQQIQQIQQIISDTDHHTCETCDKKFKNRSGLWKHNKKCSDKINEFHTLIKDKLSSKDKQQELIDYLMKENSEFKQLMLEQNKTMIEMAKNQGNKLIHSNSHNTNNNNFNLNFYLNETCKNAMNIMDFVNQLPVSIKHLEDTSRLGFAEGISKIFIDGLKNIEVSDRPIHCSDLKRETLYIKDNNEWNKESDNKLILTNAIKHVAHKNMKQIPEWTKIHPDYNDSLSKENDKYLKIVCESMSGSSVEESTKNYSKIARNILKETVIDKNDGTV